MRFVGLSFVAATVVLHAALLTGCGDDADQWTAHADISGNVDVRGAQAGDDKVLRLVFHRGGQLASRPISIRLSLVASSSEMFEQAMLAWLEPSRGDERAILEDLNRHENGAALSGTLELVRCPNDEACDSTFDAPLTFSSHQTSELSIDVFGGTPVPDDSNSYDFGVDIEVVDGP